MNDLTIDPSGALPGNGAGSAADDLVVDTTTQGFVADVLDESKKRPVLVDFWAPWCGPCRTLSPIIESAVRSANGSVKLVKMNIDDHPSIAGQLGIQSIPAVIAFVDGKPADGFVGALPEGQVKAFIEKVAGPMRADPGLDDTLNAADEALAAGDSATAAELYAAAHQSDGENLRAIAGLARSSLASSDVARARQMLAMAPPTKTDEPLIKAARLEIDLAEQAAGLGDEAELRSRVAGNPGDHTTRFELALINNASGDRTGAADELLAIIAADRDWNDQQARQQLLKFFEIWGANDDATLVARRRLSSILFS